jgi:hypothetical protein
MFVDDELIEFKILYKKNGRSYNAYTVKEFNLLKLNEEDKKKHSTLNLKAIIVNWQTYNQLQEDAMTSDESGDRHFNFKVYKENRLQKVLRSWDAKDKEGKAIPINVVSLAKLSPSIAETILRAYDEECFLSEEEEKN